MSFQDVRGRGCSQRNNTSKSSSVSSNHNNNREMIYKNRNYNKTSHTSGKLYASNVIVTSSNNNRSTHNILSDMNQLPNSSTVTNHRNNRVRFAPTTADNTSIEVSAILDESSSITSTNCSTPTRVKQRKQSQPKSQTTISRLMYEMQQYQKLVAELEQLIIRNNRTNTSTTTATSAVVGECPETTWRARVLIRSAQEADIDLYTQLNTYERTVLSSSFHTSTNHHNHNTQWNNNNNGIRNSNEMRMAQTSCRKLRRDFDRSHKTLKECLDLYDKRQKVEMNQLKSIVWDANTNKSNHNNNMSNNDSLENDFFNEAMRQRDLERLNDGMNQVNRIYKELANLVNDQQEQIDQLEDHTNYAETNVKSAADRFHCAYEREQMNPLSLYQCGDINDTEEDHDQQRQQPNYTSTTCGALSPLSRIVNRCHVNSNSHHNQIHRFDSKITFTDDQSLQLPTKASSTWNRNKNRNMKNYYYDYNEDETKYNHLDISPYHLLRVDESFKWYMPFETIREDIMTSVREDIVHVGKSVVSRIKVGKKNNN